MAYSIKIIGAVGEVPLYRESEISALLQTPQADLEHGGTFTGRPGTHLYLGSEHVLKIRNELRFSDPRSAERWAQQALDKERAYQIYHPHKTWFVASAPELDTPLIGNITPRLTALHTLLLKSDSTDQDIADYLIYLDKLFAHYCRVAHTFNLRLDEGLSNFGVTPKQQLYYLDDDTYPWDRFVSCSHTFGVYFRTLPWLNAEYAQHLGHNLRGQIQRFFNDLQYTTVLAEQLRDVFLSNESQRHVAESFSRALIGYVKNQHAPAWQAGSNRYLALLADVHANLPALEAVLEYLRGQNIHNGVILGDIVGYGPHPGACIDLIRELGFMVLRGNHDHGLATGHFQKGFSKSAAWVLDWSSRQINDEQKNWLLNLPPVWRTEHWIALHGAPIDPTFFNAYVYEMTYEQNLDYMQRKNLPLCFHGHTHLPGIYGRIPFKQDRHYLHPSLDLSVFNPALLCPGSVGQPRNHGTGAQFAVYDQEQHIVNFHSVPYNLEKTLNDMDKQGFPETLGRILEGKY